MGIRVVIAEEHVIPRDSLRLLTLSGSLPIDLRLVGAGKRLLPGPLAIAARADSLDLKVAGPLTSLIADPSGGLSLDVRIAGSGGEGLDAATGGRFQLGLVCENLPDLPGSMVVTRW